MFQKYESYTKRNISILNIYSDFKQNKYPLNKIPFLLAMLRLED